MSALLKKYRLWWLLSVLVCWIMALNAVAFACTGLSLIIPTSDEQRMMIGVVSLLSTIMVIIGFIEGVHLKETP